MSSVRILGDYLRHLHEQKMNLFACSAEGRRPKYVRQTLNSISDSDVTFNI